MDDFTQEEHDERYPKENADPAGDKHIVIDKDSEAAVADILEKATREPCGSYGETPGATEPVFTESVFPKGVAAVLHAITPMGVPLTQKEQADKARAKELVDELFERIPWDDFMSELDGRGHILKSVKEIRARVKRTEEYRHCHREAAQGASEKFESIKTVLSAASLFLKGLYVEEGEPEVIRTMVESANTDARIGLMDIKKSWERINEAGAS